jgi:hypothetical protein
VPSSHQLTAHQLTDVGLVNDVCQIAGERHYLSSLQAAFESSGIAAAVARNDDEPILNWLLEIMNYQGIADQVARRYLGEHDRPTQEQLRAGLERASCPKLTSYWHFEHCQYHKGSHTCAEPEHMRGCPLPRYDLRNGRLNQTAHALSLFQRDVAGNLISFLDEQLSTAVHGRRGGVARATALRDALFEAFGSVHGLSGKMVSMALADMLIGAGQGRPLWEEAGKAMVAVDTLVHNWLARTGVIARWGVAHTFGAKCYAYGGCQGVLDAISLQLDARKYGEGFPRWFPRFVQRSIWTFCAADGLDICNGNQVDDRRGCGNTACPLWEACDRQLINATAMGNGMRRIPASESSNPKYHRRLGLRNNPHSER